MHLIGEISIGEYLFDNDMAGAKKGDRKERRSIRTELLTKSLAADVTRICMQIGAQLPKGEYAVYIIGKSLRVVETGCEDPRFVSAQLKEEVVIMQDGPLLDVINYIVVGHNQSRIGYRREMESAINQLAIALNLLDRASGITSGR